MNYRQQKIDLFADRKIDRDKLYRETPIQLEKSFKYIDIPKQPSGFIPMEEIKLEGIAYQSLASGKQPWWVTSVYCFMCGYFLVMGIGSILSTVGVGNILSLVRCVAVLLFILPLFIICWRGIRAKISRKK